MPNIYYKESNKPRARQLRREMTRQERHLWYDCLKTLPVTFRRQKQFGPYIVDFYCAAEKLVVELDGSQHYEPESAIKDGLRTNKIESLGIKVIRYTNIDIHCRFQYVCEDINNTVKERMKSKIETEVSI